MAMNKFAQAAIKATTLSELMGDREKLSVEDIIKNYPNGVTVTGFDIITLNEGETAYPVFIFAEDDTKFFNGGAILTNIVRSWVEGFGGDIEAASKELAAEGGVKMMFIKDRTKNGNNITKVKIMG